MTFSEDDVLSLAMLICERLAFIWENEAARQEQFISLAREILEMADDCASEPR